MGALRKPEILLSEAEYWYDEDNSAIRHEYFEGQITAMAGATERHNDVAGNILTSLKTQLRGNPYRARMSDQRIKVETTTLQTYPDIVVVCPPFRRDLRDAITLLDATVIVEVLSPSTRRTNRFLAKFNNYIELPSLRHYLLVEPDQIGVEHRFKTDSGAWEIEQFTALNDEIALQTTGCRLTLREIYEEIEFEA